VLASVLSVIASLILRIRLELNKLHDCDGSIPVMSQIIMDTADNVVDGPPSVLPYSRFVVMPS
jgi:hypothetical protein